ncbi:Indigoidine synthase A like protein-domain-containing protein [Zopfochytrium polystomum]|nr:Indigoidine synthase A like protein-domain-containing protein [Zopfochytrium polystomum]
MGLARSIRLRNELFAAWRSSRPYLCRYHSTSFPACPAGLPSNFDVLPEISSALKYGRPVVALESTIISHGMPYPQNLTTAKEVESIVREEGSVPATIALLDGRVKIGLTDEDLSRLALAGESAVKASRRDLALVASRSGIGSTTVSATMILAHLAGIKVFVTGGIGGVHRGGEESMDVSADLTELGRTPVAVVSAGVKSILDIGRTLEYLETQGVPVVSYGTDKFPAFYTRDSGFKSIARLDSPRECAELIRHQDILGLQSGMLIAVPIPEKDAVVDSETMNHVVKSALKRADKMGITGKDITPFLLAEIKSLTQGKSLEANISLIRNNARVGSRIASELATLVGNSRRAISVKDSDSPERSNRPLIIGGSVLDITSKFLDPAPQAGTSSPGHIYQSLGGVGRNVAEACHRTGGRPVFYSAVGNDYAAETIMEEMASFGMDVSNIEKIDGAATASYSATLDGAGEMLYAVADMAIHHRIGESDEALDSLIRGHRLVAFDGNLSVACISRIIDSAGRHGTQCLFEPTSVPKAVDFLKVLDRVNPAGVKGTVRYVTPNGQEAIEMAKVVASLGIPLPLPRPSDLPILKAHEGLLEACYALTGLFAVQIIKLGADGVLLVIDPENGAQLDFIHLPPAERIENCVSVTGAGDTLVGAFLSKLSKSSKSSFEARRRESLVEAVLYGQAAAALTLMSPKAVSPALAP